MAVTVLGDFMLQVNSCGIDCLFALLGGLMCSLIASCATGRLYKLLYGILRFQTAICTVRWLHLAPLEFGTLWIHYLTNLGVGQSLLLV